MSEADGKQQPPAERHTSQPLVERSSAPHSNRTGWDGKLRINKKAVVKNADALESDGELESEDELPGEEIPADQDLLDDEDPDTEEIDAQHSRIASIPALRLERFPKLVRLGLRQNSIQTIELPEALRNTLEELELYDNLISHIPSSLESYDKLRSLDLSYNKIRHIKNVSPLRHLTHLYFVQNKISKIENLEGLDALQYLELGANRIKEIGSGLSTLTTLTQLWLGGNRISSLSGLSTLKSLRTLSIQANRIESLEGIEDLPQLAELYISDNKLTTLAHLEHNVKLEILDVQSNPLSDLKGVEGLTVLENFWASSCKLDSFEEIRRALADKERLTEVYFEGNPVQRANEVLYRNKVRLALPQVTKIDATHVQVR